MLEKFPRSSEPFESTCISTTSSKEHRSTEFPERRETRFGMYQNLAPAPSIAGQLQQMCPGQAKVLQGLLQKRIGEKRRTR